MHTHASKKNCRIVENIPRVYIMYMYHVALSWLVLLNYCHTVNRSSLYGNAHGSQIKKDTRSLTDKGIFHFYLSRKSYVIIILLAYQQASIKKLIAVSHYYL